jgi:hypothetical protein
VLYDILAETSRIHDNPTRNPLARSPERRPSPFQLDGDPRNTSSEGPHFGSCQALNQPTQCDGTE